MSVIKIKFAGQRKINRINIFAYPQTTNVQPDATATPIESMLIEYATDLALTTWVAWAGLEDRSEEIGLTATTIANGLVSGNVNTYNAFYDKTGVSAYGVRITPYGSGTVNLCEIEVWQSLELTEFNRIDTDVVKDLVNNKFKAGIGAGTYVANPLDYYPGQVGNFEQIQSKDINKMKARLYGGFSEKGLDYWTIMGHFTVYDWTVFQKSKKIEFRIKDRVKDLRDASVFLASETLENKTREWLIEWMGLKANLHSDEMQLFDSNDSINFFYPVNAKSWDEMNEVAAGLDDVSLYVDRYNKLHFEVYLENIPYFWKVQTYDDFNLCTLTNLQLTTENGVAVVKPTGNITPTELVNDTLLYESGTDAVAYDKWYEVDNKSITANVNKMTLQLTFNVKGGISTTPPASFNGSEKIQIFDNLGNFKTEVSGGGNADSYKENSATVDLSQWFSGGDTVVIKRLLKTKYYKVGINQAWITSSTTKLIVNEYARYFAGGDIVSYDKNLSITPTSWGLLKLDSFGSGVKAYTDSSPDGITWEGWKEVIDGEIKSTLNQYVRWKIEMEARDLWGEIPKLYKVTTGYNGGQGQNKYSNVDIEVSDDDIEELPMSFSDEREGERTQYDKVEVVVNPFYLQASKDVWTGVTGWLTEAGKTYDYTPELENPVKVDADFKLIINGDEYQSGETTQNGLKVTFTKHPVKPTIEIEQLGASQVSITEFRIEGKEYKQTSPATYSAGDGNKVLRIENKYINSGSFAQSMADKKLYELQEVKESIARDMSLFWCPTIRFQGLVSIRNEELGFTKLYQIYSVRHTFNALSALDVRTKIRTSEINESSMFDPGYWGELREGKILYWGLDAASAKTKYWGGKLYV